MRFDPYSYPWWLFTLGSGHDAGWMDWPWNRIVALCAPWMTAGDAFQSQPAAAPGAVGFNGLQKIFGTAGVKTAARSRPAERLQQRRESHLINAYAKAQNSEHQGARIEVRLARRNHSCSSAAQVARAAAGRAIVTTQVEGMISC